MRMQPTMHGVRCHSGDFYGYDTTDKPMIRQPSQRLDYVYARCRVCRCLITIQKSAPNLCAEHEFRRKYTTK